MKAGLYETVITNLPADRFSPPLLRELYHKRWGIETSFRDLKYTLALTHFHAKKRPFIQQEILSRMTLYNFASLLRLHAVVTQPEGQASLPCERRFCRSYCPRVPAWLCSRSQSGSFDHIVPASCPAWLAKTEEYARKTPGQLSVPDGLGCFTFVFRGGNSAILSSPFFLMYVFAQPPPRSSPGGGCVGVVILMRLSFAGGLTCVYVVS